MWVKIETVPSNHATVYLPDAWKTGHETSLTIQFGQKVIKTDLQYLDDLETACDNSFETPDLILMTDSLKALLLIPDSLTLRMIRTDAGILLGPVIGLLLGINTHRYTPRHMMKYTDRLGIYPKLGGLVYAFSPKSIQWKNNSAYGLYYNMEASTWIYGCFPLPDVIYRRDFHSEPGVIKRLCTVTDNRLFNSYRFTKYELYEFVNQNSALRRFQPATELSVNFIQVRKFIDRYQKVILKPVDLSRGRGICVIEAEESGYKITDYRYRDPISVLLTDEESLERFFTINHGLFDKYLIQQYLHLAQVDHCNFDIRVVMQKRTDQSWGCTGAECRVSQADSHLTNISRGGDALTLEDALKRTFPQDSPVIASKILDFCTRFCRHMDTMGEHFAEFGMDIAIDTEKNIWLIEANVFPSFKGIKRIDQKTYLDIRYAPMLYALSLTPFAES